MTEIHEAPAPRIYWEETFDNYPSARDWLTNTLTIAVGAGLLRDAGIMFDWSFDRQAGQWKAWARVSPVVHDRPTILSFGDAQERHQ